MNKNKYPLLTALMSEGLIYLDEEYGEYIGRIPGAPDDGETLLGLEGEEEALEYYLEDHRTPDRW